MQVPQDYVGIYSQDIGVIDVRAALGSLRQLAEVKGAKLIYNATFINLDEKRKEIEIETMNGERERIAYKRGVVMARGGYSVKGSEKTVERIDTETFRLKDFSGMPPVTILFDTTMFYSLRNDPAQKEFKIGIHGRRDLVKFMEMMRKFYPTKIEHLSEA